MPKSRAELNKYSRQWRKNSYLEKRFNKTLHEYIEIKHRDIFNEYVRFYNSLNEIHPDAKDITKTKTYKQWKKTQLNCEDTNSEMERSEPRNEESPEQSEPRNEESLEQSEPRNEESPEQSEPRNEESPEQSEPRNEESPEQSEPRNEESPEQSEPRNEESPERSESENERNILAEALEQPIHPDGILNVGELDNLIQHIIDDLQQDDDVRALLNDEELFHPQYREDDEGIAMDIELETDELTDLRLEEGLMC